MSQQSGLRERKAKCPNCGAAVIVGSARAAQRVKCPKCAALMPVDESEAQTAAMRSADRELKALRERVARLEARVSALEAYRTAEVPPAEIAAVATKTDAEINAPLSDPTPTDAKLKWVRSSDDDSTTLQYDRSMPDRLHEQALVHNLRVLSGNQIIIRSAAGNEAARRLAERFKQLFTEAEWRVVGVADVPVAANDRGLSLAAGSLPPSREATRTYLAFTAAGFSLASRLDVALQSDETMLVVA